LQDFEVFVTQVVIGGHLVTQADRSTRQDSSKHGTTSKRLQHPFSPQDIFISTELQILTEEIRNTSKLNESLMQNEIR
jgi:hypothetical protein